MEAALPVRRYHSVMRTSNLLAFILATLAGTTSPAFAADLPATSRAEIDTLLNRLGASGCQFSRNGNWYSSIEAKAHLAKKLNYLVEKKKLEDTEQFIKLGASSSSMSGKPYQVRCGDAPAVASEAWLTGQLRTIRSASSAPK